MMLQDRVAVVTGGTTGIGLGIARVLASLGAKLVLAQINLEETKATVQQFAPARTLAIETDVADRQSVARMIAAAVDRFERIDILVNNAGVTGKAALAPFLEESSDHLDHVINVNFKGVYHCSQVVAQQMVASRIRGSIVQISSVGAYAAQEFAGAYCATKAAVVSLARSMALELAPHGIRVNCVAPGDIYTETNAAIVGDLVESGATGNFLRKTPLDRRGSPDEIGRAVAFLCSDDASFVTGTTLVVDGGFLSY